MPPFRDPKSPVYDMPADEARRLAEEYRRLLFERGDREAAAQLLEKIKQQALQEGARLFEPPSTEPTEPNLEEIANAQREFFGPGFSETLAPEPSPTPRPIRYSVPELTAESTRQPVRYSLPERTSETVPIVPVVATPARSQPQRTPSPTRPQPQRTPSRTSTRAQTPSQMLREARTARTVQARSSVPERTSLTTAPVQPSSTPTQSPGFSLWPVTVSPTTGAVSTLMSALLTLGTLLRRINRAP